MRQVTPLIQVTSLRYCHKLIIILTVNLLVVKCCNVNIEIEPLRDPPCTLFLFC